MGKSNFKTTKYISGLMVGLLGAAYLLLGTKISINEALLFGCGSFLSLENILPLQVIITLPPMLVYLYSFADVFSSDFLTVCVYVFTRTRRRGTWLLKRASGLFFQTIVYWLILILCYLLIGNVANQEITLFTWHIAAEIWCLQVLVGFFLSLVCNILSLKISLHYALLSVIGSHLLLLFVSVPFYKSPFEQCIRWIPSANGVYGWHELSNAMSGFAQLSAYTERTVTGLYFIFSLKYLLVLIFLLILLGMVALKKADLMNMEDK